MLVLGAPGAQIQMPKSMERTNGNEANEQVYKFKEAFGVRGLAETQFPRKSDF